MKRTPFYFAYGSNLNLGQMRRRCPGARRIGPCELPNFRLVFRGVADIEPSPGDAVHGAIYRITKENERALDRYEGYDQSAPGLGLYRKERFVAAIDGKDAEIMFYTMNRSGERAPSQAYFESILEGYRDWKLPVGELLRVRSMAG